MRIDRVSADSELAELVRRGQAGEQGALRALFDRFHRNVMAFCVVATRDRELAMDLTQDVFARAFRSLNQVRQPERFPGWLFTIAGNVCHSRVGQEIRQREFLETLALEELSETSGAPDEETTQVRILKELLARETDGEMKTILVLKYGDPEHTTRQIAEQLKIPHGTVTVKLMRFRSTIKKRLLRLIADDKAVSSAAGTGEFASGRPT